MSSQLLKLKRSRRRAVWSFIFILLVAANNIYSIYQGFDLFIPPSIGLIICLISAAGVFWGIHKIDIAIIDVMKMEQPQKGK